MKILKKNIVLIMLFGLTCNFFIAPITNIYAEESSEVKAYITLIDDGVTKLQKAIDIAKLGTDYIDNASYKYAIDKVEEEINDVISNYNNEKTNLGNSVSLEKLLNDSNSSYLEDYNNYFTEDEIILFDNIKDISYSDGIADKTITKDELNNLINETYFKKHLNKIDDLNNNYAIYISNYQSFYDEENKSEANNEASSESKNKVNKRTLQSVPSPVSEENEVTKDTLIQKIEDLKTHYENFEENELKITYTSNDLVYNNPDYTEVSQFNNIAIQSFITTFEKGVTLDNEYQSLITKVNKFLEENPNESNEISTYINELNSYYTRLNKDNMIDRYSEIVFNADETDEDIIDTLLGFTILDKNSSEYEYLLNAKIALYPISLYDYSLYTIEIKSDYLIISGSDNILSTDFISNINYDNFKIFDGVNTIIDSKYKLALNDRNGNLLRTLKLLIKNDVNGDGLIDTKDINSLRSKLLKEEFNNYDYIASDINNDNIINIVDLTTLDTTINNKQNYGETTKASFNIVATKDKNKIIYDIYLNTDGIVNGFEFNINTSSNLKLLSITSSEGVFYQNNSPHIKTIGLGSYKNNTLLMTVTYENLDTDSTSTFTIDNGILIFDNAIYTQNVNEKRVVSPQTISQNEISETNTVIENNSTNNATFVSIDKSQDEPKEVVTLESEDDNKIERKSTISGEKLDNNEIVWGNVIRIALIVLLGALIIYFLNKDGEEEKKEFLKEKEESKE